MCLGIPGQVIDLIDSEQMMARVDVAGVKRPVNIACIVNEQHPPDACIGDWVLVHVGFAMSRIDAAEAEQTLAILAELGDLQEEQAAMREGAR